jgi:hypothetical protein
VLPHNVKGEEMQCALDDGGKLVITAAKVRPHQLRISGVDGGEKGGAKITEGGEDAAGATQTGSEKSS